MYISTALPCLQDDSIVCMIVDVVILFLVEDLVNF